jgi:hypothetical protein
MEESDGAAQGMTAEEHHREFPYDERPVHPTPTEVSPGSSSELSPWSFL